MRSTRSAAQAIVKALVRSRTMLWVCVGSAAQLIVVSAIWSWLPRFLNRAYGLAPGKRPLGGACRCAAPLAAWCGCGGRPCRRPPPAWQAYAMRCCDRLVTGDAAASALLSPCRPGSGLSPSAVSLMTCTRRAGAGARDDVTLAVRARHRRLGSGAVHEPVRPGRGAAPIAGVFGVQTDGGLDRHAGVPRPLAPLAFSFAARTYEADMRRAGEPADEPASRSLACGITF
jgi:hypothetical protein